MGPRSDFAPLAVLVTMLLFARSGLYGERAVRPGLRPDRRLAVPGRRGPVRLRLVEDDEFSSYYIFYGTLFFALFYVSAFRWAFERATGLLLRAAGYHRRAVLVGRGAHIEAVAHALTGPRSSRSGSSRSSRARRTA